MYLFYTEHVGPRLATKSESRNLHLHGGAYLVDRLVKCIAKDQLQQVTWPDDVFWGSIE